ncbi:MAG TPA: hypothetical protein V6D25_22660 [Leptolyngbyaceae cyanobacterium]
MSNKILTPIAIDSSGLRRGLAHQQKPAKQNVNFCAVETTLAYPPLMIDKLTMKISKVGIAHPTNGEYFNVLIISYIGVYRRFISSEETVLKFLLKKAILVTDL